MPLLILSPNSARTIFLLSVVFFVILSLVRRNNYLANLVRVYLGVFVFSAILFAPTVLSLYSEFLLQHAKIVLLVWGIITILAMVRLSKASRAKKSKLKKAEETEQEEQVQEEAQVQE